jgi:multiple sugar transport system permease protein
MNNSNRQSSINSLKSGNAVNKKIGIPYRYRKYLRVIIEWVVTLILGIIMLFPIIWMIKSSFQPLRDLLTSPAVWFPRSLFLGNYATVFRDRSVMLALKNSLIVSLASTLSSTIIAIFASYAFVRFRFRGRNALFVGILFTQMLPAIALVIPFYILMRRLGIMHSHFALVLAYVSFTLPYTIWLLRAYMIGAPWDLEDQAKVDGCTRLGALIRVIIPTILPGLLTAFIYSFINAWNEFLFALVLSGPTTKTFPIRLSEYISMERIALESMFAAGVIGTIPAIILVIIFGRYMLGGLTAGALKG